MLKDNTYKVKWILVPRETGKGGLYGTTTHHGGTPAAAAVASAEKILRTLGDEASPREIQVLSVSEAAGTQNLLSQPDLQMALRYHSIAIPCEVAFRPLC